MVQRFNLLPQHSPKPVSPNPGASDRYQSGVQLPRHTERINNLHYYRFNVVVFFWGGGDLKYVLFWKITLIPVTSVYDKECLENSTVLMPVMFSYFVVYVCQKLSDTRPFRRAKQVCGSLLYIKGLAPLSSLNSLPVSEQHFKDGNKR